MAHSIAWRNIGAARDGQSASGSDDPVADPVAGDDHRPIVQRRILKEYIHYEPSAHEGIHLVAGFDYEIQRFFSLENYQGSCLRLRHGAAGLCQLVDGLVADMLLFKTQKLVYQIFALAAKTVTRAEFH